MQSTLEWQWMQRSSFYRRSIHAHSGLQVFLETSLSSGDSALLKTGWKTRDSTNLVELLHVLQSQLNEGFTESELQIRSKQVYVVPI